MMVNWNSAEVRSNRNIYGQVCKQQEFFLSAFLVLFANKDEEHLSRHVSGSFGCFVSCHAVELLPQTYGVI